MAELLGADGDYILYNALESAGGGQFLPFERVRNVATGADARLSNANFDGSPEYSNYRITANGIFGQFETPPTDCMGSCIGRWSLTTGAPITISNPALTPLFTQRVRAKDKFVAWVGITGSRQALSLYDAQSSAMQTITPPVDFVQIRQLEIVVVGGLPVVYYWTVPASGTQIWTLYRWSAANGSEVVDTTTGFAEPLVDADGDWVAYTMYIPTPGGPFTHSFGLVRRPVAGGPSVSMASNAGNFVMNDGVLAWLDGYSNPRTLSVWSQARGTEVIGQLNDPIGLVFNATNGHAIYRLGQGGVTAINTWNGATGAVLPRTTLNNDRTPFVTGNWLYFNLVTTVYRIAIN
jgi:hypothetical protein